MKIKIMIYVLALSILIGCTGCSSYQKTSSTETFDTHYVKFQDRASMDWDYIDGQFLLKLAQYKGGSIEDRAYNILVTLNIVWKTKMSIENVVLKELYNTEGLSSIELENIIPDDSTKKAMKMIIYNKFDNSNGSTVYRNGDK